MYYVFLEINSTFDNIIAFDNGDDMLLLLAL